MKTHEHNTEIEVVSKYYTALGERNIDMIIALFAEQIDWYIPGNEAIAPWLGVRQNRNQVKEFFELLWLNTKPISATIEHIVANENVVISAGNFETLMLKTEKIFKSIFFTEITVIDGQIVKYVLLEDTFGLVNALTK